MNNLNHTFIHVCGCLPDWESPNGTGRTADGRRGRSVGAVGRRRLSLGAVGLAAGRGIQSSSQWAHGAPQTQTQRFQGTLQTQTQRSHGSPGDPTGPQGSSGDPRGSQGGPTRNKNKMLVMKWPPKRISDLTLCGSFAKFNILSI